MTTMIDQTLLTDGSWTEIAAGPIANILLAGPSRGWEIFVGAAPTTGDSGMPVTSPDGSWGSSVLDASDAVYARPFGAFSTAPIVLSGMRN